MKLGKFELNKIYVGDCLELMKYIPDESVDLILADPPYGVRKDKWDKLDIPFLKQSLVEMKRICKGTILMYASMKYLKKFLELNPDRLMFFIKDFIQIMPTSLQWATDPILVFWGKNKPPIKPLLRDWFKISTADTSKKPKVKHLAIKPIKAIVYLVNRFSNVDNIVLDPFIGSGTTGVACIETGRHFIGFDNKSEYIEIANRRLSEVQVSML